MLRIESRSANFAIWNALSTRSKWQVFLIITLNNSFIYRNNGESRVKCSRRKNMAHI